MGDETRESAAAGTPPASHFSGAFGAGFVLVVLPSVALVVFLPWFDDKPSIGLPIVAVFGIMILFGAMALVSTLFARLQLDNKLEALALPAGSVRAFIALALIVLFALISVMLFESFGQPYKIENLSEESKAALVKEPTNHVSAVIPVCAAASASSTATPAPAASAPVCTYTVHLLKSRGPESADFSKQLLILIGTLMTSVVSFYFASRAGEANTKNIIAALTGTTPPTNPVAVKAPPISPGGGNANNTPVDNSPADSEDAADGCHVPVVSATADQDLPLSTGGTEK